MKCILITCLVASFLASAAHAETFAPNEPHVTNETHCVAMRMPITEEMTPAGKTAKNELIWHIQNLCTTPVAAYIMDDNQLLATVDNIAQNQDKVLRLGLINKISITSCEEKETLVLDDATNTYSCE